MKLNLTPVQWLALIIVVLGAITGGTAQLNDIVGPAWTKVLVAIASLGTSVISGFVMVLTGQANLVRSVQDMPGVEKIVVNEKANAALATLAVNPSEAKIITTPEATAAVQETAAKG